jgi:hypothetical protein
LFEAQARTHPGQRPGNTRPLASRAGGVISWIDLMQTAITSAKGQPPVTAATAVKSAVTQVTNSANALESAASGKCQ